MDRVVIVFFKIFDFKIEKSFDKNLVVDMLFVERLEYLYICKRLIFEYILIGLMNLLLLLF